MTHRALPLAVLLLAAADAAPVGVELDFSASIALPPLSLQNVIGKPASATPPLEIRGGLGVAPLVPPKPRVPSRKPGPTLPLIEPDATVDYKMVIVPPDPNVDFKLAVKRVESPDGAKK